MLVMDVLKIHNYYFKILIKNYNLIILICKNNMLLHLKGMEAILMS